MTTLIISPPGRMRAVDNDYLQESIRACACLLRWNDPKFSNLLGSTLDFKMTTTTEDSLHISDQHLPQVLSYLNGFLNTSIDFSKPNLNPHFAHVYPLFIGIYGLLIVLSVVVNLGMVYHIYRHQLHEEPTCAFLVNIALANVIIVSFVLPITLAVLLIRNWIFGQTICLVLPLLQVWWIGVVLFDDACARTRPSRYQSELIVYGNWFITGFSLMQSHRINEA